MNSHFILNICSNRNLHLELEAQTMEKPRKTWDILCLTRTAITS